MKWNRWPAQSNMYIKCSISKVASINTCLVIIINIFLLHFRLRCARINCHFTDVPGNDWLFRSTLKKYQKIPYCALFFRMGFVNIVSYAKTNNGFGSFITHLIFIFALRFGMVRWIALSKRKQEKAPMWLPDEMIIFKSKLSSLESFFAISPLSYLLAHWHILSPLPVTHYHTVIHISSRRMTWWWRWDPYICIAIVQCPSSNVVQQSSKSK